jgi:hypothetical protein
MCSRCHEIGEKISRYRRLSETTIDRAVIEHLNAFIASLESDIAALHPVGSKRLSAEFIGSPRGAVRYGASDFVPEEL